MFPRSSGHLSTCWFLFLLLVCGAGCGSDVVVSGSLVKSGAPVSSDPNDQVTVTFIERVADPKSPPRRFPTRVDAEGKFVLTGPNSNGIPPGKYLVIATNTPLIPVKGQSTGDKFRGAFAEDKSTWVVDVSSASPAFTFDIDKIDKR